jgi:hypothetical protein
MKPGGLRPEEEHERKTQMKRESAASEEQCG